MNRITKGVGYMCKVSSQINKCYSNNLSQEYIILSKIYKAIENNNYEIVSDLTDELIEIQYTKGDIEKANILSQSIYRKQR